MIKSSRLHGPNSTQQQDQLPFSSKWCMENSNSKEKYTEPSKNFKKNVCKIPEMIFLG